jgi:hypothetical protein
LTDAEADRDQFLDGPRVVQLVEVRLGVVVYPVKPVPKQAGGLLRDRFQGRNSGPKSVGVCSA